MAGEKLPQQLVNDIQRLSGQDVSDMRVHYSSPKAAQLGAQAFTQGNDIHLAPGQDRHLAHEAWHVVQQKQGRVRPTMEVGDAPVPTNIGMSKDKATLETERRLLATRTPNN